jgi:hypothetical protein
MPRRAILLAALCAAALSSCDGGRPAPPPASRSELAELAAQAEAWAQRAETITQRPWAARLEFPKRLHVRIQTLRSYVQEAAAAAAEPAAQQARLLERGRALVVQSRPFDAALLLLERLAPSIDQINGYERLIEIHMPPLETKGEAPFRIRLNDLSRDKTLGFRHLDQALTSILDQLPDATTHENIAAGTLRRVLETATKLSEEAKQTAGLATAVVDRERLLKARIEWADGIRTKLGDGVPPEAVKALDDARALASGGLSAESSAVLDKLRNAQPGAAAAADELGRRVDAAIEAVTRAFLDLGRKAGVPDPR